jgi:hypothetical protein
MPHGQHDRNHALERHCREVGTQQARRPALNGDKLPGDSDAGKSERRRQDECHRPAARTLGEADRDEHRGEANAPGGLRADTDRDHLALVLRSRRELAYDQHAEARRTESHPEQERRRAAREDSEANRAEIPGDRQRGERNDQRHNDLACPDCRAVGAGSSVRPSLARRPTRAWDESRARDYRIFSACDHRQV